MLFKRTRVDKYILRCSGGTCVFGGGQIDFRRNWRGGRLVFYHNRAFSGAVGKYNACSIGTFSLLPVLPGPFCRFISQSKIGRKNEASFSSVSDTGRTLDHISLRTYPAMFTVEAALLFGMILLLYGFLIQYSVRRYHEVTWAIILEETIEQARYGNGNRQEIKKLEDRAGVMGNTGLSPEAYRLEIQVENGRTTGKAKAGAWSLSMETDTFRAAEFLRRLEAARKIGEELTDGWSGVQTGDES